MNWRQHSCPRERAFKMAVTKIWQVRARLNTLLDYVGNTDKTENPDFEALANTLDYAQNPSKTEQRFYVTGINCSPETAYASMQATYALNDKPLKVLAYHAYQSFAPGEVTATQAHEIGVKLAERMWGREFQVVVGTHLNTGIYHNHFVVCSTSFIDGHRYHQCTAATKRLRKMSDALCKEYELSVIENPERFKTKNRAEWYADTYGYKSWKDLIREDLDQALAYSITEKGFAKHMNQLGYEVKWGKEISVRPPGKQRFTRPARQLSEKYSIENLHRRFAENRAGWHPRRRPYFEPDYKRRALYKMLKYCKRGSLFWLYYHYRYHVFLHKQAPPTHYVSPYMRGEIRKLDSISRQMRMLARYRIDSLQELEAFKSDRANEVKAFEKERASLYGKASRIPDPEERQPIRERINEINDTLKTFRRQLRDCTEIKERSLNGTLITKEVAKALGKRETDRSR